MKDFQASRPFDLEDRTVDFAVLIIDLIESLPSKKAANHLANQLVRSGTAPALIYGEAQASESRKDFIHKMQLALKELRESNIAMKILEKKSYGEPSILLKSRQECEELIAIFRKSIQTAKSKL